MHTRFIFLCFCIFMNEEIMQDVFLKKVVVYMM